MAQQRSAKLARLEGSPSLTERIYATLLEAIQSLALTPGEYYTVQDLADQLGVSRTPLSTALRRLEQDGLVTVAPYKGVYVLPILARDVEEILELRILLESHAARKAAELLTMDELTGAEQALQQMEAAHAHAEPVESAEIGHDLHELMLSKVDNERLVRIMLRLDTQYTRIRRYSANLSDRGARSISEHKEILSALKAGDGEGAASSLAKHLRSVRDDVLGSLFPDGATKVAVSLQELEDAKVFLELGG